MNKYPGIYKALDGTIYYYLNKSNFFSPERERWEEGCDNDDHKTDVNITAEYLTNTYGRVESKEHAEFIVKLAEVNNVRVAGKWIKGKLFCFASDCEGKPFLSFYHEQSAKSDNEKLITIPLPPKESQMPDFNVETPMPKVKPPKEAAMSKVQINVNNNTDSIVHVTKSDDESNIFIHVDDSPKDGGGNMKPTGIAASAMRTLIDLKYTYHGGEMWKPPLGNAIEKSKEWPQVGEVVIYETDDKPMSHEDCNLDEHCIVGTWKSGDELSVIAIVSKHGKSMPVVQNKRTQEVSTILIELIKKPPTPEEELESKIKGMIEFTNYNPKAIAEYIINGEIEGLEYKPQ